MRSLERARSRAHEVREALALDGSSVPVLALEVWCKERHGVECIDVAPSFLDGADALVVKVDGYMKVNETLAVTNRTAVIAHELGHLELHAARLDDRSGKVDPIMASVYLDDDRMGIARYSHRMREEVEAEAFAIELLCPAREAFAFWSNTGDATVEATALQFGVTIESTRAQLASGLYLHAQGESVIEYAPSLPPPDPQQLEAIRHCGGHALIDAGPGTGKTSTLAHRVAFLIDELGVTPEHILVLTFSNEAAEELRSRIAVAVGHDLAGRMEIQTFHGFGYGLLHVYHAEAERTEDFTLLDDDAQVDFISGLLGRPEFRPLVKLKAMESSAEDLLRPLGFCAGRMITGADLGSAVANWTGEDGDPAAREKAEAFAKLYRLYQLQKAEADCVDFNDLIWLPYRILSEDADVLATVRERYRHILVDEFQDVTPATSMFLGLLAGDAQPVWVVGDARQAIYRFLGASPANISRFEHAFPAATKFQLATNYRATAEIVTAANQLATLLEETDARDVVRRWEPPPGPDDEVRASGRIRQAVADTDADEVSGVVQGVEDLIARGVAPEDIAVLARRNEDVRGVAVALSGRGVDVSANNLLSPDGAAGDLIAIASLADEAGSACRIRLLLALGRDSMSQEQLNAAIAAIVAGTDLGQVSVDPVIVAQFAEIQALARRADTSADAFATLVTILFDSDALLRPLLDRDADGQARLRMSEFASVLSLAIAFRASSRAQTAREARLRFAGRARRRLLRQQPAPVAPPRRQHAVRVMTCHASKGLEFPYVFVVGQSDRKRATSHALVPRAMRPDATEEAEQANSLLFVAVTRAKQEAFVSFARRARHGTSNQGERPPVPLLAAWQRWLPAPSSWANAASGGGSVSVSAPWGMPSLVAVNFRALDANECGLQRYLEVVHRLGFPEADQPLYPRFIGVLRQAIGDLLELLSQATEPIRADTAVELFDAAWRRAAIPAHPHSDLYIASGQALLNSLANHFPPIAQPFSFLPEEPLQLGVDEVSTRLGLIGTIVDSTGTRTAIGITAQSVAAGVRAGRLNWSGITDKRTVAALAVACQLGSASTRIVVSISDGTAYPHSDSRNPESLGVLVEGVVQEARELVARRASLPKSTQACERCRVRLICPSWLDLLPELIAPS